LSCNDAISGGVDEKWPAIGGEDEYALTNLVQSRLGSDLERVRNSETPADLCRTRYMGHQHLELLQLRRVIEWPAPGTMYA